MAVTDRLMHEQNLPRAIAIFESLFVRYRPKNYWVYHRMGEIYTSSGRSEAAFFVLALAHHDADEDSSARFAINRGLFRYFEARGCEADAEMISGRHVRQFPGDNFNRRPKIAAALERSESPPRRRDADHDPASPRGRVVIPASHLAPFKAFRQFGGEGWPYGQLEGGLARPPISVVKLENATVMAHGGKFAIVKRNGGVVAGLSVAEHPELVRDWFAQNQNDASSPVELEAAAIISDKWGGANYAHFLLDNISRLGLYERAGVALSATTILGLDIETDFQRDILAKAGVTAYLGLQQPRLIQCATLYVSTNCARVSHIADFGALWAMDDLRARFCPQSRHGERRLYVSRADARKRRIVNEDDVVAMLAPFGFEKITPGQMSFEAQVDAFSQASHVAGGHGAAMANIVFAPPGLIYLEAFHPLYWNNCFAMMAQGLSADWSALIGRDGYSDEPEFNDRNSPNTTRQRAERDIRIDLDALRAWAESVC